MRTSTGNNRDIRRKLITFLFLLTTFLIACSPQPEPDQVVEPVEEIVEEIVVEEPAVEEPEATATEATENEAAAEEKPSVRVTAFCGYFKISPQTVTADQPVVLFWNWHALGESFSQDYVDAVSFTLTIDGEEMDVSQAGLERNNDDKGYYAVWHMPALMMSKGSHEVVLTETLTAEVSDGADSDNDGNLDTYGPGTTIYPPCQIIVE